MKAPIKELDYTEFILGKVNFGQFKEFDKEEMKAINETIKAIKNHLATIKKILNT